MSESVYYDLFLLPNLTVAAMCDDNSRMKVTPTQLAAYLAKSERTIHRWMASGKLKYKKLPGGIIEVDDSLLFGPENEQENAILTALGRIEQKLDMLAAYVDTLPKLDRHPRHTPPDTSPAQSALPDGLVAWRDYAKEKGYPESTVLHAIDKGQIPIVRGKWKKGRVYILAAIDEAGKQAMDELYGH